MITQLNSVVFNHPAPASSAKEELCLLGHKKKNKSRTVGYLDGGVIRSAFQEFLFFFFYNSPRERRASPYFLRIKIVTLPQYLSSSSSRLDKA
jgi:hypothetical protein